jgi:type IV pilus assembly protein PilX
MRTPRIRAQRGLVLVCALLLLAATMVIGVAVARGAFALMASARGEGDRIAARAMAQAALRDAERDIAGAGAAAGVRAAWFDPAAASAFPAACGSGADDRGLCGPAAPPAWQRVDLAAAESGVLVPYGQFTGAALAVGSGTLPARLPGYLVEKLEPAGADAAQGGFYRITAIGFGMRASTYVVLQGVYRRAVPPVPDAPADEGGAGGGEPETPADGAGDEADPAPATGSDTGPAPDPPRTLPAGRIGWREIANWPELHARAQP